MKTQNLISEHEQSCWFDEETRAIWLQGFSKDRTQHTANEIKVGAELLLRDFTIRQMTAEWQATEVVRNGINLPANKFCTFYRSRPVLRFPYRRIVCIVGIFLTARIL